MKIPRIIIPGGNGWLGRLASQHFAQRGWEVVILTRTLQPDVIGARQVLWDGVNPGPWMAEIEDAAVVLNLAGRSVNCRCYDRNRRAILDSRVQSTEVLGQAMAACQSAPKLWINASSATIYRHSEDREMDETTGEIGEGFSVEVCQAWEAALQEAPTPFTRKVALRSGMVMGLGREGVFEAFHRLIRLKLGGTLGSGRQFVSWVHWEDFLAALDWIIGNDELSGPINLTSPNPLPNRDFMRVLREATGHSLGLPAPAWLLAIGAFVLRTETELVLKSRRVIPARLLADGFFFNHPHWETAARDLLGLPIHPLVADRPVHAL